ncbi:hypothetical protein BH18VER1_BH18VER1_15710 [soil metagenome]
MTDDELARVRKLAERARQRGESLTLYDVQTALQVRRQQAAELLRKAGIVTDGQERRRRLQAVWRDKRIEELPFIDVAGVHMQHQVELAAFLSRGIGMQPVQEILNRPLSQRTALTPSVVATDRLRISEFEVACELVSAKLSAHFASTLDERKMLDWLDHFARVPADCELSVLFWIRPSISPAEKKVIESTLRDFKEAVPMREPLNMWIATCASHEVVGRLGPGFFPILGITAEWLKERAEEHTVRRQLSITWRPDQRHDALAARMHVCDALAAAGLLYGAPLSKIAAMGSKENEPISRRLLAKDSVYGVAVESAPTKQRVQLGIPTLLVSNHLCAVGGSLGNEASVREEKIDFDGKLVDCLVASLAPIREMLLRALEQPLLNERLAEWLKTQDVALAVLPDGPYLSCASIINSKANVTLEKAWGEWRREGQSKDDSRANLAAGLLLTLYDADFILRHLITDDDRKTCDSLNGVWRNEVANLLEKWRVGMISNELKGYSEQAREAVVDCFNTLAVECSESRVIRFFLEQAAARFSALVRDASPSAGMLANAADPMASLMKIVPGFDAYWPRVALRHDFLFVDFRGRLRRKVRSRVPALQREAARERETAEEYQRLAADETRNEAGECESSDHD